MCFILRFFLFFFSFVICIIVHSTCFVLLDKAANLYSLFCSNFSRLIFRIFFFFFVSRKLFTSDSSHIVLPLDNIPCLGYPCVLCCRISTSKGLFRPFYVSFFLFVYCIYFIVIIFCGKFWASCVLVPGLSREVDHSGTPRRCVLINAGSFEQFKLR